MKGISWHAPCNALLAALVRACYRRLHAPLKVLFDRIILSRRATMLALYAAEVARALMRMQQLPLDLRRAVLEGALHQHVLAGVRVLGEHLQAPHPRAADLLRSTEYLATEPSQHGI
jgi:hypothetical protein